MTKVVFKSYNQNDNLLFPPCLGDFIAENDPVRVLNAVVDHMDIREIRELAPAGAGMWPAPMRAEGFFTEIMLKFVKIMKV